MSRAEKDRRYGYEIKTLDNMIGRKVMSISIKNGMDQLTVMHGWIIGYLYKNQDQDIYQKDLEAKFCITRSTVTNILKLMEKKGYIQRVAVAKDARLKKIVLTEKALNIQQKNYMDMHEMMENELVAGIEDKDLVTFLEVIRKMKQNLGEIELDRYCDVGPFHRGIPPERKSEPVSRNSRQN
ncbi:MAG: MarR family winged helix-turn-helix transcriptional regulator [Lachnospiraceae bacterium]|nr:MarR family winged helix-turn-helix transcriptional regulator [Lachnospiraceae bacterium]MDD3795633.1 MarR family winged helix-turn-helix transcriptional regulator [Lachnospiraceae bacterium]